MKAVIAEKPSVAREIASLLGATEKRDGYLTGNGYSVTWAFGHLVGLGMPEDYGIPGFRKAFLPILPDPFLLTIRKIKKGKEMVADPGAAKQLKAIKHVIGQCDSIIVATDAGREGELIFRYIYEYLKCTKPFQRLWISSLTEKAIKTGFENLKPGSDFDRLYRAAQSRSRADWLVGINASQALSIAAGSGVYSLGRVQTPALALVCRRYLEHRAFRVEPYWQIQLTHRKEFTDFKSISEKRWTDKKQAEKTVKSLERGTPATVTAVTTKTITEQPPLLFDLTGLQKEANKRLNLSAGETLNIAQSLYEQKFITYPRTGSRYIPDDLWPEIPGLIRSLQDRTTCKETVERVKYERYNKRIVNDLKVTDHHGLLITGKIPSALSPKEYAIFDLIAFRLLEAVSQPCVKETTGVKLEALHHVFTIKGRKIITPGWRIIRGNFTEEGDEDVQELPELAEGDELKIKEANVLENATKPPLLHTEAGLLAAMETAGKQVDDEAGRKALQQIGIGTPATRAAIIETLFSREYIIRKKKSLIPTEKGLQVYHLVKERKIADVAMTAEWELSLTKIENGESDAGTFQKAMQKYATTITHELLNTTIAGEKLPELTCPKCKSQQLLIRDKVVKCPDEVCNWLQFRTVCGVPLSLSDIESFVTSGKTGLIRGMKSKSGKQFDAYLILRENGETGFAFRGEKDRRKN